QLRRPGIVCWAQPGSEHGPSTRRAPALAESRGVRPVDIHPYCSDREATGSHPVDTVTPPRFVFPPCPPGLARNARTYEITQANGVKIRRTSSDPGRALLTGFVGGPAPADDWNKLDMPGLHGIRNTAPYF